MPLLRLFGGLSLEGPAGPIGGRAAQRRRLALLALLAVEAPRPLGRDRLIGLLWPESDTARARHLLRDTLYLLRGALGEEALLTQGDEITLDPARLGCDVWTFRAAVDRGDHVAAAAAYMGPFLDGVFIAEAHEFGLWVDLERERLARRFAEVLEALAEQADRSGDRAGALRWWQRLAEQDRLSARVAVRLMRAFAIAGDRAGALRHANVHAALLETELGVGPDSEVVAYADELRHESRRPEALPLHHPTVAATALEPVVAEAAVAGASEATRSRGLTAFDVRRRTAVAAAVVLLIVGALGAQRAVRARDMPAVQPHRVVVVPLENRTGDTALDALGSVAADWIAQGLAASGVVDVVSFSTALRAARNAMPSGAPTESTALPRAMAAETGAGIVVFGSFLKQSDSLLFQIKATDARSGRVLAAPPPVGAPIDAPLVAIEALRERTLAELATSLNPQLRQHTVASTRPPNYQAYLAYAEGMANFIEGDWAGAITPLQRAAGLDTTFTLPLVVLGIVYFNLGERAVADSAAAAAAASRDRLAAFDRALLAGLQAWLRQDHEAAYRAFRTASELAPGSMATVQVGIEARRLNRPREAIRVMTALDPTRGELRGDPYYWLDLSLAYHQLGDHRRELRVARRGALLSPGDPVVRLAEIRALAALGRGGQVGERVEELLVLRLPDWLPPVSALRHTVFELRRHGHAEAADAIAERSLVWYRGRPSEEQGNVEYRRGMAELLYAAEQWEQARAWFEALATEEPDHIHYQGHLGVIAARQQRSEDARQIAARLALLRLPYDWGASEQWRAAIAAQLGEPDTAIELLRDAVARGRLRVPHIHSDPALEPVRDHPSYRELMRPRG